MALGSGVAHVGMAGHCMGAPLARVFFVRSASITRMRL